MDAARHRGRTTRQLADGFVMSVSTVSKRRVVGVANLMASFEQKIDKRTRLLPECLRLNHDDRHPKILLGKFIKCYLSRIDSMDSGLC